MRKGKKKMKEYDEKSATNQHLSIRKEIYNTLIPVKAQENREMTADK